MAGNEKVPYINYKELEEFYSIADVCRLLKLSKDVLKKKGEKRAGQTHKI